MWQPYRLLRRWAQQLRGHYDLAFILRFDHWWGALLAYLAGVPKRVGYAVPEVAPFLSHRAPHAAGRHEVEQNLRLIGWNLSAERSTTHLSDTYHPIEHPLEYRVPADAVTWVKNVLPGPRPIAIHPGAGAAVKLWQTQKWAVVADALARETDAQIILTGSESERPLCREVAAQMEAKAHVMAGKTTLGCLSAILAECRLVLGVDSGPLHLAVAVGTPTIHLYGPVDSATFGPWGPAGRHRALVSDWPCIPCNRLDYDRDELAHHPCVREIDPNSVLAAARQSLSA
jgi:ADP-heptose:LPS heptosyltransferase